MKEGEYIEEFGCSAPIRWLHKTQVTICRNDGQVIRCKCGNPATCGIVGASAELIQCPDCFKKVN